MTMLVPRSNRNFFNSLMSDPFETFFDNAPLMRSTPNLMRTDIKEHEGGFELIVDLPGYKKEDVTAELKDGVLSVTAQTSSESTEQDLKGTYVRKERFSGKCSRSYYVGEDIQESDVHAKFENGILKITVPKKQLEPKLDEKLTIAIED